jgi:arylsulfatase A-like enzyme
VGVHGARVGIQKKDPTLAELLKPLGYVTVQFGKNHLEDRNEFLPTNHESDEFFGNFYSEGMVAHDIQVGELLKQHDNLRISGNTIIL